MSQYKEYIVTLKNMSDSDKFYEDMEQAGGEGETPDRPVECVCRRPMSRNTHYWLDEEEAEKLKKDERVLDVELLPEERGIRRGCHYNQTATNWDKSNSEDSSYKNWGLLRSVEGQQRSNWGSDITPNQSGSISVTSSGLNVDVVIVDEGHIDPLHPEFSVNSDGTGGSRVIQYNWFQHNPEVLGTAAGNYDYSSLANHSTHVSGTVAGNTQGWARGANIYNISFNTTSVMDYVRAFHNSKSINPITGRKNPTIMNNSWGSSYSASDIYTYITGIFFKGTMYPGPFTWLQLVSTYGLMNDAAWYNGIPARSTSLDVDTVDAIGAGIVCVGSAGNSDLKIDILGQSDYDNRWYVDIYSDYYHRGSSPCSADGVICVGSVSDLSNETKSYFSSCGPRLNIFSPGHSIMSSVYTGTTTDPRNASYKIAKYSGTSMASPQVCGVLACALEQYPNMTQEQSLEYITNYAKLSQMSETHGGYGDFTDLQGAPNKYLFYYKERPDSGFTYPNQKRHIRPTSGVVFPRPKIRR